MMKDCTSTESCTKPNVLCAYPKCARGESRNVEKKTPSYAEQAAEIDRLKAELELRTKERDQAIENGGVDDCSPDYPDLHEHFRRKAQARKDFLAGRGE